MVCIVIFVIGTVWRCRRYFQVSRLIENANNPQPVYFTGEDPAPLVGVVVAHAGQRSPAQYNVVPTNDHPPSYQEANQPAEKTICSQEKVILINAHLGANRLCPDVGRTTVSLQAQLSLHCARAFVAPFYSSMRRYTRFLGAFLSSVTHLSLHRSIFNTRSFIFCSVTENSRIKYWNEAYHVWHSSIWYKLFILRRLCGALPRSQILPSQTIPQLTYVYADHVKALVGLEKKSDR